MIRRSMSIVLVALAWALCACGGPRAATSPVPAPHAAPAPLTRTQMLAALPADTKYLLGLDLQKLRHSPLAIRAWEILRKSPKAAFLDLLCGEGERITYVLVSLNFEKHEFWAWISGADRTASTCAKAHDASVAHHRKTIRHGDYESSTADNGVSDALWVDAQTLLVVLQAPGATPLGEPALRTAIAAGQGITSQTRLGAMLDHVDFASSAVFATDGALAKYPEVQGVASSIEADADLRAQLYVQFDTEDHASRIHSRYRAMLDKGVETHLFEAGDTRMNGTAVSASLTLTEAQIDLWIQKLHPTKADPDASVSPSSDLPAD